jgi:hypothetical protein
MRKGDYGWRKKTDPRLRRYKRRLAYVHEPEK